MSQDIRKWFMKQHGKDAGNGNTSNQAKPSTPQKPPVVQGEKESSSRRKTSKYFSKDAQSAKDEMEVEEVSAKKAQKGSTGSPNVKPPSGKKTRKFEISDDDDDDDDFATPTSRKGSVGASPNKKLKSGSGKGVARKIVDDIDEDDDQTVKSNAKSAGSGRGRGAKGSAVTQKTVESMDVDKSDAEDMDDKDVKSVKPGGRGRGGRGAPASGRGRGGGGRGGGFMNFGERKDPPHKGEKEVPEGAPECLNGLTFVISGTLDSLEREEAEDLIKRHGGRVTGSVSKKTNYLLCDEDIGGRKSEKAKELGTAFITEDGLFDMIRASNKSRKPVDKVAPSPPKKSPQKPEKSNMFPSHASQTVTNSDTKGLASISASSKRKNQSSPQTLLSWTEKYRPKVPNDIVGNQSLVKQLHDWLVNWNEQFLDDRKKGKGKKQSDSGAKKAVLLSGTPGIGKTTSAKLVSQMLGFQTIEVNASDSRGKADGKIERGIHGSTSNSIKELVNNQSLSFKPESSQHVKTVLIMDEVDGMSAGDRGGVADLIASIKISKIPIICICNDRYSQKLKSLVNYCLLLSYRKPTKQQVAKRLSKIASSEGLQANEIALEELAERTNGDIRMAVNHLQYMSLSMSVIKFDDIRQRLQSNSKDEDISPFTAVDKLFGFNSGKLQMDERINLSMSDPDLVPLLIQENYINYRPSSAGKDDNGMKRMNFIARAAESIGNGDIINVQIRRYRQWQLSQSGCIASCITPAALLHGQRETLEQGERNFNRFGGWLGKNSTAGKNNRLLEDLHVHLLASRESNLGRSTLRLDYLTLLSKRLTEPLKKLPKDEAVEKVVEFMELYSISMEDFDTIVELSKFKGHPSPLDGVLPAVKAALTKAYNKGSSSRIIKTADLITLPGIKKAPKKRVAAMLEPLDETLPESTENDEENLSDAEDLEDDLADPEKQQLQSDLQSLNSKAIKVQMELKGAASSSGKKAPSGRGGGRGSGSASKRKR
ncbi:LOW QUALITY PROTEIN: replication factor C subunit 1 [Salvia miltiorrhiza]|uniref:LOW QUALITY PROTEIN: replication factor C subunit 1 n=1 Tax=Salvia miltiorrhiza TaxID=226208 RepID=UPI0025AD4FB2|nr:LOW QUALITY PROTEIN: replication factor C subunit 1 [Salvia miltiorrhiza]